ncbi:23S rRNA (uracil(1939)-C(5))-methyltransferase RlmD [Litoribrevibacter euphylliae]|uniref:23S rRNA (Uracil(1939)-C(5))-methyltransferase RlmD n=1 Tax=Litoribrevibacter euphylliae TaxID=1834034 RepID=A0ABV7H9C2_9GAMM
MAKSNHRSNNKRRSGYRKPSNNLAMGQRRSDSSLEHTPIIELDIDSLSYDGKGIGRLNGRACFVEGSLSGEKVKAQISAANNKRVEAKLIKVLEPSPERVKPKCSVYEQCGGCDLQHLSHNQQIQHKQSIVEQLLCRNACVDDLRWLDPIITSDAGYDYRRKIRLACYYDPSNNQLNIGFRAAKSKKIVAVSECQVMTPQLKSLVQALYQLMGDLHEQLDQPKLLREFAHIECVADQDGQSVCFRLLKPLPTGVMTLLENWAQSQGVSLWLRIADKPLERYQGNLSTTNLDLKNGVKIAYTPEDFLQVNAQVNEAMVASVLQQLDISIDDRVLDLFSGLGNFSLPAAYLAKDVLAVEGIDEMVEKSLENARLNGIDNFSASVQDLFNEEALSWLDQGADKIILDPPRAGAELIAQNIGRTNATKIAYVSCNPQALVRDTKWILEQGYQLESATLLDMFPQTSHIETLVIFSKC